MSPPPSWSNRFRQRDDLEPPPLSLLPPPTRLPPECCQCHHVTPSVSPESSLSNRHPPGRIGGGGHRLDRDDNGVRLNWDCTVRDAGSFTSTPSDISSIQPHTISFCYLAWVVQFDIVCSNTLCGFVSEPLSGVVVGQSSTHRPRITLLKGSERPNDHLQPPVFGFNPHLPPPPHTSVSSGSHDPFKSRSPGTLGEAGTSRPRWDPGEPTCGRRSSSGQ